MTFHGPGQLVGYPILDLREHRQDLHWYLRPLEDVLIIALDTLGIEAIAESRAHRGLDRGPQDRQHRHSREAVGDAHGFALNVTTDLARFDLIVPCGIDRSRHDQCGGRAAVGPITRRSGRRPGRPSWMGCAPSLGYQSVIAEPEPALRR